MPDDDPHARSIGNEPDEPETHVSGSGVRRCLGVDRLSDPEHRRLELYLPADESAIVQARRAVERVAALADYPDAQFAVRVLVSELFTNGVKYGGRGGRIRLELEVRADCVHVEIGDRGRGFDPATVTMPGEDATSGRGLALLDQLAARWGVERGGESRVWFELPLH